MFIDFRPNQGGSGSGGTTNYNDLENKPRINGTTLQGNVLMPIPSKTSELTNDSDFVDSTALDNEKTRAEQAEEVLDGKIVANTEAIQNKADKSTTYTKDEVDSALSSKAEASDIADIDSKLQSKADSSDVNAIAESLSTTQEIVAQKANIGDSYTKAESDAKYLTEHQSLAEYAKTVDVAATYQPKGDYLTSETDPVYTADKPNIALKSEIPSLDGYATEQWVENKNYITGYTETDPVWESEKSNYYTKDEADGKFLTEHQDISGKQDVIADLETIREGAALGATAIQEHQSLAEYAKTADMAATYQPKGNYLTSETDPVYTADKPNIALKSEIPSLDGYATEQWVNDKNYITGYTESDPIWESEKSNYYTKAESDSKFLTEHQDISGKQDVIADLETIREGAALGATAIQEHQSLAEYAKTADVAEAYQPKGDYLTSETDPVWNAEKGNYYTKTEVDNLPFKTINGISIKGDGNIVIQGGGGDEETDPVYTADKPYIALKSEIPTKTSDLTNDSGYLTSYTETDPVWENEKVNYYTKDEADGKFLTEHQDISGKQDVIADLETIREGAALGATAIQEHQSLAEYAKTADVAATYQPKGDYITEETDPIYTADKPNIALKSEIPSLDGYATEQWVNDKNFITGYTETDPVWNAEKGNYYTKSEVDSNIDNIPLKSINGQTLKGEGDIVIGGSSDEYVITYTAGTNESQFNIYKDGVKITNATINATVQLNIGSYTDTAKWSTSGYYTFNSLRNDDLYLNVTEILVDSKNILKYPIFVPIRGHLQQTLKSGTNIKSINNTSLLSSGNLDLVPTSYINDANNYAELTFVDVDGNETTLLLLKKN